MTLKGKKKKKLSFNATLTFKHFPEGQLEETAVFKLTSTNFVFQTCRQRCQDTGFPVTSAVCRQQALKLEALKQCTGCEPPGPPLPTQTSYFYHFQMALPSLCKHKGGKFTRNDAKNKKSGLSSNFQYLLKKNCSPGTGNKRFLPFR